MKTAEQLIQEITVIRNFFKESDKFYIEYYNKYGKLVIEEVDEYTGDELSVYYHY